MRSECGLVPKSGNIRSIATKFSMFTAMLVSWIIVVIVAFDLGNNHRVEWAKLTGLLFALLLVSAAISRFTIRLLVRPLALLQEGIHEARAGRLKKIQISRTGDEIEYLGESFNQMVAAIEASRAQVKEYQDLLEERILERTEQLETALRAALAASQAKSEFLANVSHELRTPMTGVIGMLDLALESGLPPEQRDQIATAQNCAHSLLALLNDLLDFSKAEAGRMVLEEIPFDVRRLVSDSVRTYAPKAQEKSVELTWAVEPAVPATLVGDPLRFRQILSNLLSNAVKFTQQGFVRVSVSLSPSDARNKPFLLHLRVSDSGTGIPKDKQRLIFEKFTQADGSISRRFGGTGLGLAIAKKLAELQGGAIDLVSEEGKGSAFTVAIPFAAAPADRPGAPAEQEAAQLPRSETRRGRILLVEDNLINQKVVLSLLTKRGYQIDVAGNGLEALDRLQSSPYELVLMDIQMPLLDGLETTRRIRANRRFDSMPVIAMTAHAMNGDKERCLEAGMNGYLAKPVDHKHLLHTIEHYLSAAETHPVIPAVAPSTGGNPAIVGQMLALFLQLAPERLKRMGAAAESGDVEALLQDAEKLHNAAQSIEAPSLALEAKAIAEAAAGNDLAQIESRIARLEAELNHLSAQERQSLPQRLSSSSAI